ncbi:MAG TPA: inositol monophosphatase family protein [Blastocatellia bacterium]|nr:inositol monophosphatase family protein [Blastocatellia bacterium]
MLDFAVRLAQDAGRLLRDRVGTTIDIGHKGAINIVTDVDLASERLIRDAIASHYPRHQVLGEEGGLDDHGSDYRWVVDPLDGTTNFAHGFPMFAVSIALEHKGETIVGVVYDPMRDELFAAERGASATLNRRPTRVSQTTELSKSLLSTGFPYDIRTASLNNLDHWKNFAMHAQALRRIGSAALDLCYVAAGRFDGFWELNLGPWDSAAGALIVEEAGGRVTTFSGGPFSKYEPEILASNEFIHDQMMGVLAMAKGR